MVSATKTVRPALTTRAWDVLEDRIGEFEQDWAAGQVRALDDYLPDGDAILRRAALIELVKVDLELQWKAGQRPSLEDYCRRYAELGAADTLPADLIFEAWWVGQQAGDGPPLEEFCQRFPNQERAFRALAERPASVSTSLARQKPRWRPDPGERIGDFEIVAPLGEGAFARVYLAIQLSLSRQVALKVSANRGNEARTMASLEHDHIVAVYSESVDPAQGARLLCMQYVPGPTLAAVIERLREKRPDGGFGAAMVDAIDALANQPIAFHPTAVRDRQRLREADRTEAVCQVGACLADALALAHAQGVVHRDIKPANILLNQYGRPLLADFNLSLDPHQVAGTAAGMFGGSLAYMSPEHLDAFNPSDPTGPEAVDARSDIYSLGVTLFELATTRRPHLWEAATGDPCEFLRRLSDTLRRAPIPSAQTLEPSLAPALDAVIRRCLAPDPEHRFASAEMLSEALSGARALHAIERDMPGTPLLPLAQRRPFRTLFVVAIAPHLVGGALNIAYNSLRIVATLPEEVKQRFATMVLLYNLVAFALGAAACWLVVRPVWQAWRSIPSGEAPPAELRCARGHIVRWPLWSVGIAAALWLPGAVIFPLGLGVSAAEFAHFVVSFVLSFLIAATYSYFGVKRLALRVIYPRLLMCEPRPHATARRELRGARRRLALFQALAGLIPLIAAAIIVVVGPQGMTDLQYQSFRSVLGVIIILGGVGFWLAIGSANVLHETLRALAGVSPSAASREAGQGGYNEPSYER